MLYGRKVGMMRYFTEQGRSVPVTVLEMGPNVVHQVKTPEKDGYSALQIGFGAQKAQRVNRAQTTHLGKAQKGFPKVVKEIRLDDSRVGPTDLSRYQAAQVGDSLTVEGLFDAGIRVDVVGTSIGKGYAGVMKRHKMAGFSRTHGTHEYFRHGGSIGCRKFPGRVFKNKRMSGHMGVDRVMQEGLEVVAVRAEENLLLVKGSVPGPDNGVVFVRKSLKR